MGHTKTKVPMWWPPEHPYAATSRSGQATTKTPLQNGFKILDVRRNKTVLQCEKGAPAEADAHTHLVLEYYKVGRCRIGCEHFFHKVRKTGD